ncbi:hypothetical protein TraAM80_00235, partial [Trypanosoma rangeli]
MADEDGMRVLSAMRAVVRWMALLLLQCLGSHPSFTAAGEDRRVIVKIKTFFSRPYWEFIERHVVVVYFDVCADACRVGGGLPYADQTSAAHQSITDCLRLVRGSTDPAMHSRTWVATPCEASIGRTTQPKSVN